MPRALSFPAGTVAHLPSSELAGELADLLALERAGVRLALLVVPAAVEDSLYRYNHLPRRLGSLYAAVDPLDPDEDLLEEAEGPAHELLSGAHLLDEVIDALYEGLAALPEALLVRCPGEAEGDPAMGRRGALLALKALARRDWTAASVMERLRAHASVALDARPAIVGPRSAGPDAALSHLASDLLGRPVTVHAHRGAVTRVT